MAIGRRRASGTRSYRRGCGCTSLLVVLVVGIVLALFGSNLGIGVSVRVPFTESNLTWAGSVGGKDLAIDTLPDYVEQKVADNSNFINKSITLTIGPAEGTSIIVLGKQEDASIVGVHLDLERK
jgi:hypothetical protein